MIGAREVAWQTKNGKFYRSKRPITSMDKMNEIASRRTSLGDAVYQSVYAFTDFSDRTSAIIDKIYVDLDNKDDPQLAMNDASMIAQHFDGHTMQWFSGRKGIGMEILCNAAPLLPEMKRDVLRRWTFNLIDKLGITTADHAVIGDINRVHRIVDTVHRDTGLHAIGLTQSELSDLSISYVKAMATSPRGLVQDAMPSMEVTEQLLHIEEVILTERLQRLVDHTMLAPETFNSIVENMAFDSRGTVFEFIQSLDDEYRAIKRHQRSLSNGATPEERWLIKAAWEFKATGRAASGSRQSEHKARVHLAKLAHECGWSFDEICDIYTGADDYDYKITKQMVRSCIQ